MESEVMISFDGPKLAQAVRESGWSLSGVVRDNHLPHSDCYLIQAVKLGRIKLGALNHLCNIIGRNPAEFADMGQIRPIDRPCEINLSKASVVALFQAIIDRTKEDYIVACRYELKGIEPLKPHSGRKMTTQSIENEMRADWFSNHLIGYITDPVPAVTQMITMWQREAADTLDEHGYKKRVGKSPVHRI